MNGSSPLLKVEGLDKYFGGLHAVNNVSFTVVKGSIKAVIGPNGAGKTTLFNMIAGYHLPTAGSVYKDNVLLTGMKPNRIARHGIFRTFQNLKLCHGLSVLDNVLLGYHTRTAAGFVSGMLSLPSAGREEKLAVEKALPILDWLGLSDKKETEVSCLSFGDQRAVELARALIAQPDMLLLDEPAAGLNMHETDELAQRITSIRDRGMTVLLVEHDMSLVMGISDEILVLDFGMKIAEGTPSEVQRNQDVIRIYLGRDDA